MNSNQNNKLSSLEGIQSNEIGQDKSDLSENDLGVRSFPTPRNDQDASKEVASTGSVFDHGITTMSKSTASRVPEELEKQFHLDSCIDFLTTLRTNSSLSHYRDLPIEFSTDTFILGIGIGPIDDQTPLIPLLPPQISINSAPLVADQIPCSSTSSATIPTAEPSLDSTIPSSSNEPAPISTISQPTTISSSTSRYRWSSKDKELLIKTINETRSLNPKFNTDWKEVAKVFEGRYSEQQCRSKVYNDKSVTSRLLRKEKKSECNDSIPPKKIIDKKSPASTSSTNTLVVSSDPVISTTAVSQESKQISTGSHKVVTPVSTSKTTALNQWDQDSLTRLIIAIRDTPETAYKWTEIVRRVGGGRTVRECQAVWEHILTNPELASTFARFFGKDKLC